MRDFEKLGVFYLGREYDPATDALAVEPLLYDSKDLTTHAVCVGMTGSGKTGLCISLLEEAAIDGIPALVVDPKGDIGNLLLAFPGLEAADFRPWVDPAEALRKGMSIDDFAAATAAAESLAARSASDCSSAAVARASSQCRARIRIFRMRFRIGTLPVTSVWR